MATKFSAEQMAGAIIEANGILAGAARKLGCSRRTVHRYVKRYATVRAAYEDARETNIDYVEGKLMAAIKKGSVPAIMFFLKTVGRDRGYVDRKEHTGPGGEELIFRVVYGDGRRSASRSASQADGDMDQQGEA